MTKLAVGIHVDNALPSIWRFPLFGISIKAYFYLVLTRETSSQAYSIIYKGYLILYDCGAGGCVLERLLLGRSMDGQASCDKDPDRPKLREETG